MDAKGEQVRKAVRSGKDPDPSWTDAMIAYYHFRKSGECSDVHRQAFAIIENQVKQEIVEALLLSDADTDQIEDAFGVPAEAVEIYRELFFDTSKFINHLDRIGYVESYRAGFGKELKLRALHLGPGFIFYRFANIVPRTEGQRELVRNMFMSSAYRAMEANFNGVNSKAAQASLDHAKIMLKAYELIERRPLDDDSEDKTMTKFLTKREREIPMLEAPEIDPADII